MYCLLLLGHRCVLLSSTGSWQTTTAYPGSWSRLQVCMIVYVYCVCGCVSLVQAWLAPLCLTPCLMFPPVSVAATLPVMSPTPCLSFVLTPQQPTSSFPLPSPRLTLVTPFSLFDIHITPSHSQYRKAAAADCSSSSSWVLAMFPSCRTLLPSLPVCLSCWGSFESL